MSKRFIAAMGLLSVLAPIAGYAAGQHHQISQVTLERTPCFGACPTYKVTVKRDGTVSYHGTRFVEKIGDYTARVNPGDVEKLDTVLPKLGFWELKDKYTAHITDMPSAIVTVDCGGKTKTTDNYGGQGPAELWAVEQLIDAIVSRAQDWKKVE